MKRKRAHPYLAALMSAAMVATPAAQEGPQQDERTPMQRERASGGERARSEVNGATRPRRDALFPHEFRTIDGTLNNLAHPDWGSADTTFRRMLAADYADGAHAPAGSNRPSAREVSNIVVAQQGATTNHAQASDYLWMWGQFLDHDIVETPVADPEEKLDIPVPTGDAWFDPTASGGETIPLSRSAYDVVNGVRQQVNLITAYIDASNVYGSDEERALALRTLDGTGRLKTSAGELLPWNVDGLHNAPSDEGKYFLAGDIRANEQAALAAIHTLFVREHNHWADRFGAAGLPGDLVYELARAVVGAEMQAITYREFLPVLLGPHALPPYDGYKAELDPSIANEFAAAGYRVGHTMLSAELKRIEADGTTHAGGNLPLLSSFFQPRHITTVGIAPYLRGLASQAAQEIDPFLIDDVRNFLFGPPGSGGFDLASLNIQRGRDHGVPTYNDLREAMLGEPADSVTVICSDPEVQARLTQAYASVDDIDAWVGLLSEDHVPGALVGPTLHRILVDQFQRLRDGDRFWYRRYMGPAAARVIENQTLARIIRRNTEIGAELPDDVFHVAP